MDVAQAKAEIAKVLASLEIDTGALVRSIGIREIDVTRISDEVRQHRMTVEIELERLPGHQW